MKKLISVAVVLLFIGLAFAPTINANIGKEELVEFTTEVCGMNVRKQTVKLTQQQADKVDALFNSIREKLNTTESREEAEKIFKEAIVELDKFGLLGGLSIKQAQRLVTGGYQNRKYNNVYLGSHVNCSRNDTYYNSNCNVFAKHDQETYLFSPLRRFTEKLIEIFLYVKMWISGIVLSYLWFFLFFRDALGLLVINSHIGFGSEFQYPKEDPLYRPADGEITTIGDMGEKNWSGTWYGSFQRHDLPYFYTSFIGIHGFTGIFLSSKIFGNIYFGIANEVGLQRSIPN